MRAVVQDRYGSPDVLEVRQIAAPDGRQPTTSSCACTPHPSTTRTGRSCSGIAVGHAARLRAAPPPVTESEAATSRGSSRRSATSVTDFRPGDRRLRRGRRRHLRRVHGRPRARAGPDAGRPELRARRPSCRSPAAPHSRPSSSPASAPGSRVLVNGASGGRRTRSRVQLATSSRRPRDRRVRRPERSSRRARSAPTRSSTIAATTPTRSGLRYDVDPRLRRQPTAAVRCAASLDAGRRPRAVVRRRRADARPAPPARSPRSSRSPFGRGQRCGRSPPCRATQTLLALTALIEAGADRAGHRATLSPDRHRRRRLRRFGEQHARSKIVIQLEEHHDRQHPDRSLRRRDPAHPAREAAARHREGAPRVDRRRRRRPDRGRQRPQTAAEREVLVELGDPGATRGQLHRTVRST